jgi:hypothetical protein
MRQRAPPERLVDVDYLDCGQHFVWGVPSLGHTKSAPDQGNGLYDQPKGERAAA